MALSPNGFDSRTGKLYDVRMSQSFTPSEPHETLALSPHPNGPVPNEISLDVAIERTTSGLKLRYHLEIAEERLALPDAAEAARADDLWQTTCFELFLRRPGESAYEEFNFSPSYRWAAYRFRDVREGMTPLELPAPPVIGLDASASHFALEAELVLPFEWRVKALEAAVSAVIETMDGEKSHWALAHPGAQPDFHDPGSFVLKLPA